MMKHGTFLKWPLLPLLALTLAFAGCSAITGDDDDDKKGSNAADTFTVVMDGTETAYEEAAADNEFGYDPFLIAWYATDTEQTHLFVTTEIAGSISALIIALSFAPGDAEGEGATTFNEVRYEENYDVSTDVDPICIDDVNGTITIEETAAEVGDRISGTFAGFGPFTGDVACDVLVMGGTFSVTREVDDLF